MEFAVEFSTFQGGATSPTLPPPRQISEVDSTVTVPDGQTIIVGGLKQMSEANTLAGLAFYKMAHGDHPYGSNDHGTLESIEALTL